jgi:hypothetical protein
MSSMLDSWARAHKRQRLKELRAKRKRIKTAEALTGYMRVKMREDSFFRRITSSALNSSGR